MLERGRRWAPSDYPRKPGDPWTYDVRRPEKRNGWLDLRFFKKMIVAQAAGVGGGSLAYSSVALEAPASCFDQRMARRDHLCRSSSLTTTPSRAS